MHRKLIHSVRALGIALSLLATGLFLADQAPAPRGPTTGRTSPAAPLEAQTDEAEVAVSKRHRRARAREAMTLPFFSFAQGLRRGNRS